MVLEHVDTEPKRNTDKQMFGGLDIQSLTVPWSKAACGTCGDPSEPWSLVFLASLFFFLCSGLDSRIISSSSNWDELFRITECLMSHLFRGGEALFPSTHVGNEAGRRLFAEHSIPVDVRHVVQVLQLRQAGDALLDYAISMPMRGVGVGGGGGGAGEHGAMQQFDCSGSLPEGAAIAIRIPDSQDVQDVWCVVSFPTHQGEGKQRHGNVMCSSITQGWRCGKGSPRVTFLHGYTVALLIPGHQIRWCVLLGWEQEVDEERGRGGGSRGVVVDVGYKVPSINMSGCCVYGCTNRYSTSGLKLYRIPTGSRPFQSNRRRLWLQAIRRVDWNEDRIRNARVCSAHFVSGTIEKGGEMTDLVLQQTNVFLLKLQNNNAAWIIVLV
ncbi:hypothetical protein N1851_022489 [Merluccius polli]|uniref:THAP-type domain-containing protein n=1 Tax=Merluccius polli TaxID=89951 RepID=A0AA47MHQ0_MERPO|nr:hypothetical protein N1851_022489 [Merluccius polli]